jgi:doxX
MKNVDLGLLFLRLGLGICLFMHGFGKILHGVGGVKSILVDAGLPGFLAYFAYLERGFSPYNDRCWLLLKAWRAPSFWL